MSLTMIKRLNSKRNAEKNSAECQIQITSLANPLFPKRDFILGKNNPGSKAAGCCIQDHECQNYGVERRYNIGYWSEIDKRECLDNFHSSLLTIYYLVFFTHFAYENINYDRITKSNIHKTFMYLGDISCQAKQCNLF